MVEKKYTVSEKKRKEGIYYTQKNPFYHPAFDLWAKRSQLLNGHILEPFAGSNNLIKMLSAMGLCNKSTSFDITPTDTDVIKRDTLANFPKGYDICITNPPWLAKNSASIRGIPFPNSEYDNLYKHALKKCLDNCSFVAALVPESFITACVFQNRLHSFVSITSKLFMESDHPVGLALFVPEPVFDVEVWSGFDKVGLLSSLQRIKPCPESNGVSVSFNNSDGNVGLIALDNTKEASIRFCNVGELRNYEIKPTGRHITKLFVDGAVHIYEWNQVIKEFREKTSDVLMTCYKGTRKDGKYRRRCDWNLARGIVHHVG